MRAFTRLGRSDDLPVLREIERAAGERFRDFGLDYAADDEPASIETLQSYADAHRVWVAADQADVPVGYVLVDDVDGAAHIEQVSVLPDYQGKGLGRALIDRVRCWAAQQGRSAVTLTTFDHIPWNRPLYQHLGFRVLYDEQIGPGLRAVREAESVRGLDRAMRVVMRSDLPAPSDGGRLAWADAEHRPEERCVTEPDSVRRAYGLERSPAETERLALQERRIGATTAVVGRLILMHLRDPVAMLRLLARFVRPGVVLAFQEAHLASPWLSSPASSTLEQLQRVRRLDVEQARRPINLHMGLGLRQLFASSGLPAPTVRADVLIGGGSDWEGYDLVQETVKSALPLWRRLGLNGADELEPDGLATRLRQDIGDHGVLMLYPLVGAWTCLAA